MPSTTTEVLDVGGTPADSRARASAAALQAFGIKASLDKPRLLTTGVQRSSQHRINSRGQRGWFASA